VTGDLAQDDVSTTQGCEDHSRPSLGLAEI
jgi:hypothetical protein